jgi:hypothetical protein
MRWLEVAGTIGNPGDYYVLYVVDRGTSAPDSPRDLVSALYEGAADRSLAGRLPICVPPAQGVESTDVAFLETAGGDITVQDAPSDKAQIEPRAG